MPDKPRTPAAIVQAYDHMMRDQVAPQLRGAGFTGSLRAFTIRRGAAHGSVKWQKDGRAVRAGMLRVTANIKYWCGGGRIAELMPAPTLDTWWELRDGQNPEVIGQALITTILRYALPAILAGLEEPDEVTDPRMYGAQAHGPGHDPDGGGSDRRAEYVQPRGTQSDHAFASFTSNQPRDRLDAAYATARAPDDPRTIPALIDRLEHDPNPVIRKLIASRILPAHANDPRVIPAVRQTAECDPHNGVRWAGRYALRILAAPDESPGSGMVLGFGFVQPSQVLQDRGEVAAAGQGGRVVGAEQAGAGLQDGAVLGFGFVQPTQATQGNGEVVPAGQGVRVLGAEGGVAGLGLPCPAECALR